MRERGCGKAGGNALCAQVGQAGLGGQTNAIPPPQTSVSSSVKWGWGSGRPFLALKPYGSKRTYLRSKIDFCGSHIHIQFPGPVPPSPPLTLDILMGTRNLPRVPRLPGVLSLWLAGCRDRRCLPGACHRPQVGAHGVLIP